MLYFGRDVKSIVYHQENSGSVAEYFWGVTAIFLLFYMTFSTAAFVSALNGQPVPLAWFWLAPFKLASILHAYW
jgi:hypothetical protein